MKKFQIAFVTIVGVPALLIGILYLFNGDHRSRIKKCEEIGVAFYKEAGMYPYTSTGKRIEERVHEECIGTGGIAHNPQGLR